MYVSIIDGEHLGDFFNIFPVVSGLGKMFNEKIDFTIPEKLNTKFPSLREFLEHQPMFNSVAFSNERAYQGIQIHAFRRKMEKPSHLTMPAETYRAQKNAELDNHLEITVDNDFEFVVPDLNLDWDTSKDLCGERSHHSRRNRRKEYFLRPTRNFVDCLFLDYYNDTITTNAWKVKHCKGVFISTFTGISIMADLMKKNHVVAWDQESVDDCRLESPLWTVEKMFDRHYYRDRGAQLISLSTFSWDQVKR